MSRISLKWSNIYQLKSNEWRFSQFFWNIWSVSIYSLAHLKKPLHGGKCNLFYEKCCVVGRRTEVKVHSHYIETKFIKGKRERHVTTCFKIQVLRKQIIMMSKMASSDEGIAWWKMSCLKKKCCVGDAGQKWNFLLIIFKPNIWSEWQS